MSVYLQNNKKGYEGDEYIHEEIKGFVKKYNIKTIIETGTYLGHTTRRLDELARVISFENSIENYSKAKKNYPELSILNLHSVVGIKTHQFMKHNYLFFLDAHWNGTPLLKELEAIKDKGIKPVIVIHDFKVPGTDFGFDTYDGQDYNYEWIKPSLEKIYGQDFEYYYNKKATGARRGVIYIYPNV